MPSVTASERGIGQTEPAVKASRDVEFRTRVFPRLPIGSPLESGAAKGDSPVREGITGKWRVSRVPFLEFGVGIRVSLTSNPKY